ncbi:MAG: metallophosphoesterase [Oligoflexia bacterium]|nr:metallophosphoesterase [Oligoflexia bacterium]
MQPPLLNSFDAYWPAMQKNSPPSSVQVQAQTQAQAQVQTPASSSIFKIALLSDLHVGPTVKRNDVNLLVEIVNKQNVDAVFIAGDLLDQNPKNQPEVISDLEPLKNLQSQFGTYFVLGNHEYHLDVKDVVEILPALNIHALLNQQITIGTNKKQLRLVGLTDPSSLHSNYFPLNVNASVNELKNSLPLPTILLVHQPKVAREFLKKYFMSSSPTATTSKHSPIVLALSGHTHGGQIIPFNIITKIKNYYLKGLYEFKIDNELKSQIFVSTGAGYWGPPIRLGAKSEIVIINLHF